MYICRRYFTTPTVSDSSRVESTYTYSCFSFCLFKRWKNGYRTRGLVDVMPHLVTNENCHETINCPAALISNNLIYFKRGLIVDGEFVPCILYGCVIFLRLILPMQ